MKSQSRSQPRLQLSDWGWRICFRGGSLSGMGICAGQWKTLFFTRAPPVGLWEHPHNMAAGFLLSK